MAGHPLVHYMCATAKPVDAYTTSWAERLPQTPTPQIRFTANTTKRTPTVCWKFGVYGMALRVRRTRNPCMWAILGVGSTQSRTYRRSAKQRHGLTPTTRAEQVKRRYGTVRNRAALHNLLWQAALSQMSQAHTAIHNQFGGTSRRPLPN